MTKQFTLMDFVYWIQANKRGRAFLFYDDGLVLREIVEALKDGVFAYTTDEKGELSGVACGNRLSPTSIFIADILTTNKKAIRLLVERFLLLFPDHEIEGLCRGRKRSFKQPMRLKERLEIYGTRNT